MGEIEEVYDERSKVYGSANEKVDFYNSRSQGNIFLETSKEQEIRIRKQSPFKHLTTWKLIRFMVKSNDDIR